MSGEKPRELRAERDGGLPVEQRVALESHLRECAECAELLRELEGLSAMFVSAPLEPLPAGAMQRIEHAWDAIQDRAVLRISSWLTAAAAAVLVGALFLVP